MGVFWWEVLFTRGCNPVESCRTGIRTAGSKYVKALFPLDRQTPTDGYTFEEHREQSTEGVVGWQLLFVQWIQRLRESFQLQSFAVIPNDIGQPL
jgi:hypothetical protein